MNETASHAHKCDLALEPDFTLGGLQISPSLCLVRAEGGDERVEPRVMEVLVTLAKAAERTVTRDQLIDACWGGRVVSDDAVTRAIAKLRQLGRAQEPPHFAVETVPRVGFRLVVPPTNVSAAKTGADSAPAVDVVVPTPSRWERVRDRIGRGGIAPVPAVAAFAVVLTASIAAWALMPNAPAFAEGQVIVMPFETISADAELARLSRRTGEAVARRLTVGGVPTVLSGTPSLPGAPAPRAAEFVVTGSVDVEAGKTVIKGAISSRESGVVLWSSVAERPLAETLGLDEAFGRRLAGAMRCALRERTAAKPLIGRDVFSLFLSACEAVGRQDASAVELTRRLVKLAPDVGGAHALLAFALAQHASVLDHLSDEVASLTRKMRTAAQRALALDPSAVYAHAALGMRIGPEGRYGERENYLLRALAVDPDHATVRMEYSLFLREVGRIGAAREALLRIDGAAGMLINSAFLYAMAGDLRSAYEFSDRLDAVKPEWADDARWVVGVWWDDPSATLAKLPALAKGAARAKDQVCFEAYLTALVRAGAHPRVRGLPAACTSFSNDWRIRMLARQGDIEGAYAAMQDPLPRNRQLHMFLFYPEMKSFRRDPRFWTLVERLGLLNHWRTTNQWPDFCAEPDLPFDCRTR
jgi:DNA-binding winged helix-turn-helix (wHTH) protein